MPELPGGMMRKLLLLLVTLSVVSSTSIAQTKQSAATKPASSMLAIVGGTVIDVTGKDNWLSARFLANGITTVLDTGSLPPVFDLKRRIAIGELQGPRMLVCGPMITGEPVAFPMSETVKTPDEARRAADARVAAGADFVKTHAQLAPADLRAAIEEAHKRGLRTISHTGKTNALEAIQAGTNILTHLVGVPDAAVPDPEKIRSAHTAAFLGGWVASSLAWLQADQAKLEVIIHEMVSRHTYYSPTLSIHHTIAFARDPDSFRDAVMNAKSRRI